MEDIFDGDFPQNLKFDFGFENQGNNILMLFKEDWERRRRFCGIILQCYTVHMFYLLKLMSTMFDKPIENETENEVVGQEQIDGFQNFKADSNDGESISSSASNAMGYSPGFGVSRGVKRKAPMTDSFESMIERMIMSIQELIDVIRAGNYYYQRFTEIAAKQVEIAKKHAEIVRRQAEIAEKRCAILEQSRPRCYSENEVWSEIEKLGVVPELRMRCYRFLCRDDQAKLEFFGVPSVVRLSFLYDLMKEAGAL